MLKPRIFEIDALRGFACLMVVFNHFGNHSQLSNLGLHIGSIGIDLFFIISGFVISLTIHNNSSWKHFAINRFSRLFPTYWTCVILSVIAIISTHSLLNQPQPDDFFYKTAIANLTMLQYFLNFPNIDGAYWTLTIELLFYVFIIFFLIVKKQNLIEIAGAVFLIFSLALVLFQSQLSSESGVVTMFPLFIYFPLFYSGILFYKIKFESSNVLRWSAISICYILQLLLFSNYYANRGGLTFTEYSITLTVLYIIFILYMNNLLRFIVNKYTIWLGNISFCLYLIHQSIGVQIILPVLHQYFSINFWVSFVISFCSIVLLSNLILKYVEKPGILYIRKKYAYLNHTVN